MQDAAASVDSVERDIAVHKPLTLLEVHWQLVDEN